MVYYLEVLKYLLYFFVTLTLTFLWEILRYVSSLVNSFTRDYFIPMFDLSVSSDLAGQTQREKICLLCNLDRLHRFSDPQTSSLRTKNHHWDPRGTVSCVCQVLSLSSTEEHALAVCLTSQ